MTTPAPSGTRGAKARVLGLSLIDAVIDLVAPAVITIALGAAGVATYLSLTAAGIVIGTKAALGPVSQWRVDRHARSTVGIGVLALITLFTLARVGVGNVVAAATAGAIGAVPVLASAIATVRHRGGRRLDGFGLFVLVELAVSTVLILVSDDPRFVLARPAVYTAVGGLYMLATCRWGRPFMLDASKPMAVAGDPARGTAFEAAWDHSPRFRAVERGTTVGLAALLLAEAVLRVAIVYRSTNPDVAVTGLLAQVPAIVLLVLFILAARFIAVPRASAIVDEYCTPTGPEHELRH